MKNAQYYTEYNSIENSYYVFERNRLNEFHERFCHAAAVTQDEAEQIIKDLKNNYKEI